MARSPLIAAALELREQLRDEYQLELEARYAQALDDCSGVLLNDRGRAAGVSSWSLFVRNNRKLVDAYASEELREWFERHPHPTFAEREARHARALLQGLSPEHVPS